MAMVAECSPNMHPAIVQAIVKSESSYNQYAIGVNRGGRLARQPKSFGEAVQVAKTLIAQGANIDMGYGQINSANMNWLNLSVEQAFTPCSNLKALQTVYLHCYDRAGNNGLGTRMQRAFSCYNTGNTKKGFQNGYVTKVTNNFNHIAGTLGSVPARNLQPQQTQPVYAVKNGSIVAIEPQITYFANAPTQPQNADMSVSVYSTNNPTQSEAPETIKAENTPVKVYHSWDIFRDF